MKASELMIGDKVKFAVLHIKVTSVSSWGVTVKDFCGENYTVRNERIDDIYPIPLTEEILKANGFKNVGSYEWKDEIYVTRYRYWTEDRERMFELNFTPGYDGFNAKGFDVNEVHKLQHLLRIAKFNDLADNFKVN